MIGWRFSEWIPEQSGQDVFSRLLEVFKELLVYTSGDVDEALNWLTELDKEYKLTTPEYGIADFINELIEKGYLSQNQRGNGPMPMQPTTKMEKSLRQKAMDDLFGQIKKAKSGDHSTRMTGTGDELTTEVRSYQFGDPLHQIAMTETLKNAQINGGIDELNITEGDLEVYDRYSQSQCSTVLMIDISHSMILYGEDRITPAKKVAMALSELIITRYPKDTLDVIVFGDDAWEIKIKDLPYLQVGPYHTNTVAGLELAIELLRKRKSNNKRIMMITDGKPTCIKQGKKYYKNSFGLDRKILNRTFTLAAHCRKMDIPITTFMIATDPYLVRFVNDFTSINGGKAFYSSLNGLGEFVFLDYKDGRKKRH